MDNEQDPNTNQPESSLEVSDGVDNSESNNTGNEPEGTNEGDGDKTDEQANDDAALADDIGPKDIPVELEPLKKELLADYYAKTRELAADRKGVTELQTKAKTLNELLSYKPFQDWYSKEQDRLAGKTTPEANDFTEEQMEEIKSDPNKFDEFIKDRAKKIIKDEYGETMNKSKQQLEDVRADKQLKAVAEQYPDFDAINDAGLLDKYVDKGHDFETAYAMFKLQNPAHATKAINKKAVDLVNKAKAGSIEKGSGIPKEGAEIVEVSSVDEGFDEQAKADREGRKIKLKLKAKN